MVLTMPKDDSWNVVYAYSRAQAILDGVLVDVTEAAKAIGNLTTTDRLAGFRLNAARHDDDTADSPEIFAAQLLELRELAPRAQLFGGCCGTDVPHIAAVAAGLAADGDE